jgi:hypothetical protein
MATATEQTFIRTVSAAEAARQVAKSAAAATYAFVPANLAAYNAAIATADNVYFTAVNAAMLAAGADSQQGQSGPIGGGWATVFS